MYEAHLLVRDLAVVLTVAALVTVLFRAMKQPPVLGYLLAGIIIGPHVPIPLFADGERIRTLSELGVILVMFAIGLEFSVRRLIKLAPTAGLTGAIQLSGMFWLGYAAGRLFGWSGVESLFAGSMIAISSTMIVARTFAEEKVETRLVEIVYGVLIVQDLAAVVLLAVLTALAHGGGEAGAAVAETASGLAGFLALGVAIGFLVVPRFIRLVARLESPETLLITCMGLCFGASFLAQSLGYSVALGAFLAGSLVSESGHAHAIERLVHPIRDLFATVFFVAVGMMVDPQVVLESWRVVLVLTVLVLVAQSSLVAIGTFLAGNDVRTSVRAGMSLAQIGEFSFIIAGIGVSAGVIGDFFYPVAVAVCLVTSFTTPFLVRRSSEMALAVERRLPRAVQTFATLYASWREQLQARATRGTRMGRRLRRLVLLILVDGAILAGVAIGASILYWRSVPSWSEQLGVPHAVAAALLFTGAGALALPFMIGLIRCARGLGRLLAGMVLPRAREGTLDLAAAPRRAFVVALQLATALLVGLPFLALTQPFLPSFLGLPILLLVLTGLGVAFWRSAANLEEHVQAGAHLVLETLSRQAGVPMTVPAPLSEVEGMLPGLGRMMAVSLTEGSPAIGRTLVQLNLRGLTGASVIAIAREAGSVAAPTGHEVLAPGDVLTLTGTADAVTAALDLLGPKGEQEEV